MNKERIRENEIAVKAIKEIDKKLDRLEERFVFEEINSDQYKRFKGRLESEKVEKENLLSSSEFNSSNLKKAIERALKIALNLPKSRV
ncbi:hypothetical protein [Aquimarina agarivorans]|uniref:hypothetical protein n=1 Tax=Aquimarina agarivorans TaxID=980584 RepID=UPI000248FCEF|nr:hypothetical protein [Aquimarina agarivorans]